MRSLVLSGMFASSASIFWHCCPRLLLSFRTRKWDILCYILSWTAHAGPAIHVVHYTFNDQSQIRRSVILTETWGMIPVNKTAAQSKEFLREAQSGLWVKSVLMLRKIKRTTNRSWWSCRETESSVRYCHEKSTLHDPVLTRTYTHLQFGTTQCKEKTFIRESKVWRSINLIDTVNLILSVDNLIDH